MQASEEKYGFTSRSGDRKHEERSGLAMTGKTANRLERVSGKEIRSTLTTETKTAREKENCAEHDSKQQQESKAPITEVDGRTPKLQPSTQLKGTKRGSSRYVQFPLS